MDSSGSISNYNPFDYVSVSVGRFRKIKSFKGAIAELFVFFYPLDTAGIEEHFEDGLNELKNGDGQFLQKIFDKDQADFNRQAFATEKHIPDEVLKNVDVSPDFFQTVKEEPNNEDLNDRDQNNMEEIEAEERAADEESVKQNLNMFIIDNPGLSNQIEQLANNYDWLLTVTSILSTGDITKDGAIEIPRFMKILKFSKIKLPKSAIVDMVDITKTGTEILDEQDDQIKHRGVLYYNFLKIIKEVILADMISNLEDEDIERVSIGTYEDSDDNIADPEPEEEEVEEEKTELPPAANQRKDSFHSSPEKFQKFKKEDDEEGESQGSEQNEDADKTLPPVLPDEGEGDVPKVEKDNHTQQDQVEVNEEGLIKNEEQDQQLRTPEPESEPEVEEEEQEILIESSSLPDMDHEWNTGNFDINIIRCSDCHLHYDYCRHSEDEYVNAFNDLGNEISDKFSGVSIIGNHERPGYLGCFDVYVRGVGPMNKRDGQGRYFLFSKKLAGKFPKAQEIIDTITILCLLYGNSEKLGQAQKEFKENYRYLIPKADKGKHEYPGDMPENLKKQPALKQKIKPQSDRIMRCKNWGCGQEYQEDKNDKHSCRHHPGKYQFGSRHGLWPESWTCCRAEWDSLGCRKGFHKGVPATEFVRLCINHGEPNPDSFYPDSFCGKPFQEPENKPEWQVTAEDKEALL